MSLFDTFKVAGSGVAAQAQRLNVVASNLANADSVAGPGNAPYKARQVLFQAEAVDAAKPAAVGVNVQGVSESDAVPKRVFDPRHPLADADGYVTGSTVNVVDEMVNMISASRSYQNNIEVMNTAKALMLKTLTLGN